jgi:hypothetical protein
MTVILVDFSCWQTFEKWSEDGILIPKRVAINRGT